jgi:hypothetical protein
MLVDIDGLAQALRPAVKAALAMAIAAELGELVGSGALEMGRPPAETGGAETSVSFAKKPPKGAIPGATSQMLRPQQTHGAGRPARGVAHPPGRHPRPMPGAGRHVRIRADRRSRQERAGHDPEPRLLGAIRRGYDPPARMARGAHRPAGRGAGTRRSTRRGAGGRRLGAVSHWQQQWGRFAQLMRLSAPAAHPRRSSSRRRARAGACICSGQPSRRRARAAAGKPTKKGRTRSALS